MVYIPSEVTNSLSLKEGDDVDFFRFDDKSFLLAKKSDVVRMLTHSFHQAQPQEQQQGKGPSISISDEELAVLKKLDMIKYNDRTAEKLKQVLNADERKTLKGLIEKKFVSPFKKAGEQKSRYGIAKNVYDQFLFGKRQLKQGVQVKEKFIEKIESGEYKGCVAIDLSKIKNLPKEFQGLKENVKVLIKSDGTPTYVAKDIAFHMWKFGILKNTFKYKMFVKKQENGEPIYTTYPEGEAMDFGNVRKTINVIDVKQSFPQDILKLAFRIMKRDDIADNIIHLAYGRVELEEGTLAGRKGTWMGNTADDLLEEATKKARALLTERFKLTKNEKEKVAKAVAVAAIKFEFLKMSPEKTIIFSWKWALSFEGNSGPYCQYTYARAIRLLEDSKSDPKSASIDFSLLNSDIEFNLIKLLSKEKEMVEKTANELRTNVLTDYAIDIASSFSKFYEAIPILKAEKEKEKEARLALTLTFANTMAGVLRLLGIEPIARM